MESARPPLAIGAGRRIEVNQSREKAIAHPKLRNLMRHVSFDDASGCWNWTGQKSPKGYAVTHFKGISTTRAHRVFYMLLVGEVPKGFELDHLCRNRSCVNPDHLEVVTTKVNVLRGIGPTAINARKTHCIRGHPLSGDNLYTRRSGKRQCRICIRQQRKPRKDLRRQRRRPKPAQEER